MNKVIIGRRAKQYHEDNKEFIKQYVQQYCEDNEEQLQQKMNGMKLMKSILRKLLEHMTCNICGCQVKGNYMLRHKKASENTLI